MPDFDPLALSIHESGHCLAHFRFGRALGVTGVRGDGGVSLYHPEKFASWMLAGSNPEDPPCLWADEVVGRYTRDVISLMCGPVAEELLCRPVQGRVLDSIAARAVELVPAAVSVAAVDEAPALSEADRLELDYRLGAPGCSDEEEIAKLAALLHGDDVRSAGLHLQYLRSQAVQVVLANDAKIRGLAAELHDRGAMSGPQIVAFLNGVK